MRRWRSYIARLTKAYSQTRPGLEPEFWKAFLHSFGFENIGQRKFNEKERRGLRATMLEHSPWEAEIPLHQLASSPFPKLVVQGGWKRAPKTAQEIAEAALGAVCDVLVKELKAERAVFEEAAHNPHLSGNPSMAGL